MTTTLAPVRRGTHGFTYEATLRASHKISWQVDDLLPPDAELDFSRPLLPESFARVQRAAGLDAREKLLLNQIRGHGYLCMFGTAEEFILPFVVDHARATLDEGDTRTRALLGFAGEEAKHMQLFKRFQVAFARGFGTQCDVVGPPAAIAAKVLAHPPLSVALVILQLEWMTQRHYLDSIADDRTLDPRIQSLLRHHWMEEAQHAKLDTLLVEELAARCTPAEIATAIEGFFSIAGVFDELFRAQAAFDVDALQRASGRKLTPAARDELTAAQHQAQRWTFLGSGMTHPRFLDVLGAIDTATRKKIEELAPSFS